MRSVREADLAGKKVLLRVDFNVPLDEEGQILDDTKIKAALPTIRYILEQKAALILVSHLGRPQGGPQKNYSLKNVAAHLQKLLGLTIKMAPDSIGEEVREQASALTPGNILMLENVRFHAEEERNDPQYSKQIAALGDIFINDAFGVAHRAHSSTSGIADYLPVYAGFLLEKEVKVLGSVLKNPERPSMAIMGGAKIADKIGLIENIFEHMDYILIGGGMANTFINAMGFEVGKSLCEKGLLGEAREIMKKARRRQVKILLPSDVIVASEISDRAAGLSVAIDKIPLESMIVDIGPDTIRDFSTAIMEAKTIIWNGPLGVYEYAQFAQGTKQIALAMAKSQAVTIIGGGDSAAAVQDLGLEKDITHISTGGGATIEFLEGLQLPGVVICQETKIS